MAANLDQILNETQRFVKDNPKVLNAAIMSKEIELNKHAKLITKVRGQYPSVNGVLGHVVQGFQPKWTEMATVQFRGKVSRDYHQKVNFGFTPAEILGSWIEQKYDEGKELKDKSISQHVLKTMLPEKIVADVDFLSMNGVFNPAKAYGDNPEFGYSMDGLNTTILKNITNTDNPYFKIPIDAFTDENAIDVLEEYESAIPIDYIKLVDKIHVSHKTYLKIKKSYRVKYGKDQDFTKTGYMMSPLLEKKLVKLTGLDDNIIVTTLKSNLCRFVDLIQNPATISDIQKQDYKIKVFGEFTLGYDYGVNELVIVGTSNGAVTERGLGNSELNELYYPREYTKVSIG
ncbi:conserved hypothetical protein [Tenacibaculum sp. 190524A02b]|uniref:Major capsid protein n=1 Tax=Tenacibaculum vairaonense TaxID=3137860 RepID=A0ABP1FAA4_9FLAO